MILIDTEMPKTCSECVCFFNRHGDEYCPSSDGCSLLGITFNSYVYYGEKIINPYKVRYKDCPMIELVQCKDCIRHNDDHVFCDRLSMKDNEYCSRAKRREK